jgi:hypothetical protein
VNGREEDKQPAGVRIAGFCTALAVLAAMILAAPHSSWALDFIYYLGTVAAALAVIFAFIWLIEPWPLARLIALGLVSLAAAAVLGWLAGSALSSPRLSGSPIYAQRLSVSFSQLAKSRERVYRKIEQARKPRHQAHQLRLLSRAFAIRASSLREFQVSPAVGDLPGRLASQLDSVSAAYSKLAAVVTAPGATRAKLRRARHRLAVSEDRLHVSEMKLADHGYALEFHPPSKNSR